MIFVKCIGWFAYEESANFQLGAVGLLLPPGFPFPTKSIWSIDSAAVNVAGHSPFAVADISCCHTQQAHGSTHSASVTMILLLCCFCASP